MLLSKFPNHHRHLYPKARGVLCPATSPITLKGYRLYIPTKPGGRPRLLWPLLWALMGPRSRPIPWRPLTLWSWNAIDWFSSFPWPLSTCTKSICGWKTLLGVFIASWRPSDATKAPCSLTIAVPNPWQLSTKDFFASSPIHFPFSPRIPGRTRWFPLRDQKTRAPSPVPIPARRRARAVPRVGVAVILILMKPTHLCGPTFSPPKRPQSEMTPKFEESHQALKRSTTHWSNSSEYEEGTEERKPRREVGSKNQSWSLSHIIPIHFNLARVGSELTKGSSSHVIFHTLLLFVQNNGVHTDLFCSAFVIGDASCC